MATSSPDNASPGFVYFAITTNHPNDSAVKIGRTVNAPTNRIRDLQVGNPFDISVYAHLRAVCCVRLEAALHTRCAAQLIRGEWYRLSLSDVDALVLEAKGMPGCDHVGPSTANKMVHASPRSDVPPRRIEEHKCTNCGKVFTARTWLLRHLEATQQCTAPLITKPAVDQQCPHCDGIVSGGEFTSHLAACRVKERTPQEAMNAALKMLVKELTAQLQVTGSQAQERIHAQARAHALEMQTQARAHAWEMQNQSRVHALEKQVLRTRIAAAAANVSAAGTPAPGGAETPETTHQQAGAEYDEVLALYGDPIWQ